MKIMKHCNKKSSPNTVLKHYQDQTAKCHRTSMTYRKKHNRAKHVNLLARFALSSLETTVINWRNPQLSPFGTCYLAIDLGSILSMLTVGANMVQGLNSLYRGWETSHL